MVHSQVSSRDEEGESERLFACHKEICKRISGTRSNGSLASLFDVELVCGSARISAHRIILASNSEFFARAFTCGMRESRTRQVELRDMDPKQLRIAVDFMYTGQIEICCLNLALALYDIVRRLQIDALHVTLDKYVTDSLHESNLVRVLEFAAEKEMAPLRKNTI